MSPAITPQQSIKEAHALMAAVDEAGQAQDWSGVVTACRAALAHPCAPHAFYVADLWTGLAEACTLEGDYDGAIEALTRAIEAGHMVWPHPNADLARLHLRAGRRDEADALFRATKELTPEDPWLFAAAGDAYADIPDYEAVVQWLGEGITLAMRIGDPEGQVAAMTRGRDTALRAVGQDPDELSASAESFLATWQPPAPGSWVPPEPPVPPAAGAALTEACPHCGWRPAAEGENASGLRGAVQGTMGVAWFPSDEWSRAVTLWPDLLADMPAEHALYTHEIERRVAEFAEHTGARILMIPISVGGLQDFCGGEGRETLKPWSGAARADYAADLLRQGFGKQWPPARNEACWCGSGRKYKLCCATPGLGPDRV